ncbi:TPA: hypothetical protein HA241_07790 [Candidatus Woesearchaeota archaeon]|nr:hypothetical protein [Candidatus Woesearchaeota archaeon]
MKLQRVKYKDIEQPLPFSIPKDFKTDFQGSAPAPFIGRYGYPNVNIGILSPQYSGDTSYYDSPHLWNRGNFSIPQVANMRYGLVNSKTKSNIHTLRGKFLDICQEVGTAKKAVEVEVNLQDKPHFTQKPEFDITPFGPQAELKNVRITANPKIDSHVEKAVRDTDLKSSEGLQILYQKGIEESNLSKILSVGTLGLQHNRKLVPTRWSITAVDDTIGKKLIAEIKEFPCGEFSFFAGGGWGNYYFFLFFPTPWSYELFETYLNKEVNPWSKDGFAYSTDYENYHERKTYAEETAGGYYAARLPVAEKMKELKRQYSCLALRFITPEYTTPLGVWVCREASRKSLAQKPLIFASQELLLQYAKEYVLRKFGFNLDSLLHESRLLKQQREQKTLLNF